MNRSRVTKKSELSASDEWRTPAWVFDYAAKHYGPFTLDAAAAKWNHQCRKYFTKLDGSLQRPWDDFTWDNCPYSDGNKEAFTRWGRIQVLDFGKALNCHLVPHDTADGYWARQVEAPAGRFRRVAKVWRELGPVVRTSWGSLEVEVTAINRRVGYVHQSGLETSNARHASALVVFARPGVLRPLLQTSTLNQRSAA